MSDEEKIQIAALGLLGLFNRGSKSKPETKEDIVVPVPGDSGIIPDDQLPNGAGAGGARPEQPERPEQEYRDERRQDERYDRKQEDKKREGMDRAAAIRNNPEFRDLIIAIDELFDQIDKNGNDIIELREFVIAIQKNKTVQNIFGLTSVREGAQRDNFKLQIFDKIDKFPDDEIIDRNEFLVFMFEKDQETMRNMVLNVMQAAKVVFDQYDTDGNKLISVDELAKGYEERGQTFDDARQNLLLEDIDRDGKLSFPEMYKWLVREDDMWFRFLQGQVRSRLQELQQGQLKLGDIEKTPLPETAPPTKKQVKKPQPSKEDIDGFVNAITNINLQTPPKVVDVDLLVWGGISKAAQKRMSEEPEYSSLRDFLLNIKTEQEFDDKITRYDMTGVATFLGKLRNKEISGKKGIIAELGLRTKKAEDARKEREMQLKRSDTRVTVNEQFKKLKINGLYGIELRSPRGWRKLAEAYAAEKGLTTDGITVKFKKMMAILYVEEHKNDPAPKGPGLFMNLHQPTEPRLRF